MLTPSSVMLSITMRAAVMLAMSMLREVRTVREDAHKVHTRCCLVLCVDKLGCVGGFVCV
jgi:hypothetical protein